MKRALSFRLRLNLEAGLEFLAWEWHGNLWCYALCTSHCKLFVAQWQWGDPENSVSLNAWRIFFAADPTLFPARQRAACFSRCSFECHLFVRPAVMKFFQLLQWLKNFLFLLFSFCFPQYCITATALHWMLPNGFPRHPHTMQFNSGYTTLDVTPMFWD